MVKREYQDIQNDHDTNSLAPITKVKTEIIRDDNMVISSAKTPPKKRAKSQSCKSSNQGEGPNTPKSKSPAKSVSPLDLIQSLEGENANRSDGLHPKMKSSLE